MCPVRYLLLKLVFAVCWIPTVVLGFMDLPDFYQEPGRNPSRALTVGNDGTETIDPFTGILRLQYQDLLVPGNAGLDVAITRVYHSNQKLPGVLGSSLLGGRTPTGVGWEMHFGRLYYSGSLTPSDCYMESYFSRRYGAVLPLSDRNPVIELQDGSKQVLFNALDSDKAAYNFDLITQSRWKAVCVDGDHEEAGQTYNDGGIKIWSPDGTAYTIDRRSRVRGDIKVDGRGSVQNFAWHVTRIEDRNGNWIEFDYIPRTEAQYTLIDKIRTSDQREVRFFYIDGATGEEGHDTSHVLLHAVEANGQRYEYEYLPLAMDGEDANEPDINVSGGYYLLHRVVGPEGMVWQYDYHLPGADEFDPEGLYSMRLVTAPFGGQTSYTYLRKSIGSRSVYSTDTTAVETKTTQGPNIESGSWNYEYYLDQNDEYSLDITEITTPIGREIYLHCGTKALFVDDGLSGVSKCNGQEGALVEKRIYAAGAQEPTRTELYTWGSIPEAKVSEQFEQSPMRSYATQGIFQRVLLGTSITQGANTYSTYNVDFDAFANPTWTIEIDGPPLQAGDPIPGFGERNRRDRFLQFEHLVDVWALGLPKRTEQPDFSVEGEGIDGTRNLSWIEESVYDSNGNLTSKTVNGHQTHTTYHVDGSVHTVTDSLGRVTRLEDYYRNIPRLEVRPDGVQLRRTVLPTGLIESETNARGLTTTYAYDGLNRITAINKPRVDDADILLNFGFVAGLDLNEPARTLTRDAFQEQIWVDGFGREILKSVDGIFLAKRYDALGRQIFLSYPGNSSAAVEAGPGKQYIFDVLGRAIQTINTADGTTTRVELDLPDFQERHIDERANVTTLTYRAYGSPDSAEVMRIESPDGPVTELRRLRSGQVLEALQRSADGALESFRSYVPAEDFQLDFESHPETGITQVEFDAVGKLISSQTGTGAPVMRIYDVLDRLKTVRFADPNLDTSYQYDPDGNVLSVIKGNTQWTYSYDDNDNLLSQTLALTTPPLANYTVSYEYDALDALKTIVLPSGMRIDYTPSPRGWPTQLSPLTDTNQPGESVQWHSSGMLKSIRLANGAMLSYALNERNFVETVQAVRPAADPIALSYDYDVIGNVLSVHDDSGLGSFSQASYDAMNRLVALQHSTGPQAFEYDALGNLRRMQIGDFEQSYDYDAAGAKLINVTGDRQRTMSYGDPYGNITADGRHGYEYTEDGNLVRVIQNIENSNAPQSLSLFEYDAMDRRARETTQQADEISIRHFVHDQAGMLLFEEDFSRCLTKSYIRLSRMTFGWREARSASDQDEDGIVDCVEYQAGLDMTDSNDAELDLDNDGLPNREEYFRGLNIDKGDSDGDGMPDGYEVANSLEPLSDDAALDLDGDGFSNIDEMRQGTKPNDPTDYYRARKGDVLGELQFEAPRFGSIIALEQGAILLRNDDDLVSLTDLTETSRTSMGTDMDGFAQAPDGTLIAYDSFPDHIKAFDASGHEIWTRDDINLPPNPAVLLHPDGLVLLCDSDSRLIALELRTGEERWRRSIGHAYCARRLIVAANGLIVVYSERARGFVGLTAGGAVAFVSEVVEPFSIVPGLDVFYTMRHPSNGTTIEQRDYRSGRVVQTITLDYEPRAIRVLADEHLLILGVHRDTARWVLEQRNPQGELAANFESDAQLALPLVAEGGTILTGIVGGFDVYALKASSTEQQFDIDWQTRLERALQDDLAIGRNGTLYVPANGGYLYSIHTDTAGLAHSLWPAGYGDYHRSGVSSCSSSADEDADNVSDCIERSWDLDPDAPGDVASDPDSDGLSIAEEVSRGTHPFVADSDADLVVDGAETNQSSNPLRADSALDHDGDGASAFHETLLGTSDADPSATPDEYRSLGSSQLLPELANARDIRWAIAHDGTRVALSYTPGIGDRVHAFAPTGELLFEVLVASTLVQTANRDQSERRVLALTANGDVLVAVKDPVWAIVRIDRQLARIRAQYRLPQEYELAGNVVLDNEQLYVLAHDTRTPPYSAVVFAFDLRNGGITSWQRRLDVKAYFLTGGLRGEVYVTQDDATVVALDGTTGEELWRSSVANRVRAVPSVDRDGVLYLSALPYVYALAPDGDRLWFSGPDFRISGRPQLSGNGGLLIGRDIDDTVVFETDTGHKKLFLNVGASFLSHWDGSILADTSGGLERIETNADVAQSLWQLAGVFSVDVLARNGDLLAGDKWIGTGARGGLAENGWPARSKDLRRTFSARTPANVPLKASINPVNYPPIILIQLPLNESDYTSDTAIVLKAGIFDEEDSLSASDVQWSLADGPSLGNGLEIAIQLPAGPHIVVATVTDAAGLQSHARAMIDVTRPTVNLESSPDPSIFSWNSQDANYESVFEYPFDVNQSAGRALIVDAYDIEHEEEVSVRFNNVLLGYLPVTAGVNPVSSMFLLPDELFATLLLNEPDQLRFEQHMANEDWGVGSLRIVDLGPVDTVVNAHGFSESESIELDEYWGDFEPQGYFMPNGEPLENHVTSAEYRLGKSYRIASDDVDHVLWLTAIYLQADYVSIWIDGAHFHTLAPVEYWLDEEEPDGLEVERRRIEIPARHFQNGYVDIEFRGNPDYDDDWGVGGFNLTRPISLKLSKLEPRTFTVPAGLAETEKEVRFEFESDRTPLQLRVQASGVTDTSSIAIKVNGTPLGHLDPSVDDSMQMISLAEQYLVSGRNQLTFIAQNAQLPEWQIGPIQLDKTSEQPKTPSEILIPAFPWVLAILFALALVGVGWRIELKRG